MGLDYSYLDRNMACVQQRLADASSASGRAAADILLMPAVKYADAGEINHLHKNLGVDHIGENRVQQLLEHWEGIEHDGLKVHFIGSLQTNKVKYIIDKVCLIHSLDSERLCAEIDRQAKKHGIVMDVLVEINSGSEESKGGVLPCDVPSFCDAIAKYSSVNLRGFMTMAPRCEDMSEYHKYFSQTKTICDEIWYNKLEKTEPPILSMGMSESFEAAIAEGSTLIRVGRALFAK